MSTGVDAPDFVEVIATACCVLFLRTATFTRGHQWTNYSFTLWSPASPGRRP